MSFSSIEGNLSDRILQIVSDQQEREVPLKSEIPLGSVGVKDSFLQAGSFSSQLPSCMVFLGDTTWELCRRDNMVLCQLIFPGMFPWAWRAENMWRSRREDLALCIFLKSSLCSTQLLVVLSLYIFPNKKRSMKLLNYFTKDVVWAIMHILLLLCNAACFITQWHFYSFYSHRSADQLGSQIALILFCLQKIRAGNWAISSQCTSVSIHPACCLFSWLIVQQLV